jgi:heat-inducible transcriptional repressor
MINSTNAEALNGRERDILRHVVYNFIQTAVPVGSRYISKHFEDPLSPATIRNVMADLEELGYLSHPTRLLVGSPRTSAIATTSTF